MERKDINNDFLEYVVNILCIVLLIVVFLLRVFKNFSDVKVWDGSVFVEWL